MTSMFITILLSNGVTLLTYSIKIILVIMYIQGFSCGSHGVIHTTNVWFNNLLQTLVAQPTSSGATQTLCTPTPTLWS